MRKAIIIGMGSALVIGLLGSTARAAETEQVMRGIKKPKQVQSTGPAPAAGQPQAGTATPAGGQAGAGSPAATTVQPLDRGVGRMMKERTGKLGKKWAEDGKSKVKDTLLSLPTSRIFLTQLTMTAALPSVGDLLTKAMQQGQLGDLSQGATTQALSTLAGSGGGGDGAPDISSLLLATCMRFGGDQEDCIENPKDAMEVANKGVAVPPLKLSTVLSGAGVDSPSWDLLGDVEAGNWVATNGVVVSSPAKTTYDVVEAQLKWSGNPSDPKPLAYQILEASDGLPVLSAGIPNTPGNIPDNKEFSTVLKKLGVPFSVFKLYMKECGNVLWDASRTPTRCEGVESLATFVAVGEALQTLGGIEAQLADAEARTAGWELGYGGDPMFPMLEPYLRAALPRIRAMRQGLEASTGLTVAGYSERLQRLAEVANEWDEQQLGHIRGRGR
ncbi:MAG: hypothetical protein HYY13_13675 [Nitrospirae bacterium]|nr:hypothetical protein [Nitrospirota bacterium]